MANDSFDLDIKMPPDVASIDSDISKPFPYPLTNSLDKLDAMTPQPMQNNVNWDEDNGDYGYDMIGAPEYVEGDNNAGYQHFSHFGGAVNQTGYIMGGVPNGVNFEDSANLYESKYSPSRGGQYNPELYASSSTYRRAYN